MKAVIVLILASFRYILQMHTPDLPLEQIQKNDLMLGPSKLMGIMDEVNPSLNSTNDMILDRPEFHALMTPELKHLEAVFKKNNFEIRIVGGTVRDLLDGKKPHDLDFVTIATLTEMKQMFEKEGIRMLKEQSERHDTITARINKVVFQITTHPGFVSKDDGHVDQQFSKDWKIDAACRDFTINAMYLDFQGKLYDYFNGYEDLKARKVVFIGNPDTYIKGVYISILRYFRFFGRFAINPRMHDEQTLKAIRENGAGLAKVHGQHIWSEFKRLLLGNFVSEIIGKMLDLNLTQYIGLNDAENLDMCCFNRVCHNADKYSFQPITIVAALLKTVDDVLKFSNRVKLSRFERDTALYIVNHKNDKSTATIKDRLKSFQKSIVSSGNKEYSRAFIIELLKVLDEKDMLEMIESWTIPVFPVDRDFLGEKGVIGRDKTELMTKLRKEWIANDFVLDDEVINELISETKSGKYYTK